MELWCCRRPSSSSPAARFRRSVVLLCVALTVCGVVYLGYFCPERVCALSSTSVVVVVVSNNNRNYNDHNNISGGGGVQRSAAADERSLGGGGRQSNDIVDPLEDVDGRRDDLRVFVAGGQYNEYQRRKSTTGNKHASSSSKKSRAGSRTVSVSYDEITNSSSTSDNAMYLFDIRGADVIVFLHIQKTGGTTFGRHLVHDLDLEKPCVCYTSGTSSNNNNGGGLGRRGSGRVKQQQQQLIQQQQQQRKRCRCIRPNSDTSCWLFSRFSTGWQCGLHADWTELNDCVDSALNREERTAVAASSIKATPVGTEDNDDGSADDDNDDDEYAVAVPSLVGRSRPRRRYFYVTLLRDPLVRFISEFLHVQRGATWKTARHFCDGRPASRRELPSCYEGYDDWEGVNLDEFMSCGSNLAINRQTRMLADLSLVNCYNMTSMSARRRDAIMLASAKENLRRLAFFGLCEQQQVAQYMFEETFRVNFLTTFQQLNETHVTSAFAGDVTVEQMRRAKQLNYLDVQLYEYARNLLAERFDAMRRADPNFDAHYRGLRPARPPTKYLPWEVEASDSN